METFGRDWDAKAKEFFFVRFALVVEREREREVLGFCNFVFYYIGILVFFFFFLVFSPEIFSENKFQFPSSLKRCKDVRSFLVLIFFIYDLLVHSLLSL